MWRHNVLVNCELFSPFVFFVVFAAFPVVPFGGSVSTAW